ncbi:hypothetical protein ACNHUS_18890 [Actinomycetes bacterium M1A6_2h]
MLGVNSVPHAELSDSLWVDLLPWLDEYDSTRAAALEVLAPGSDWWLSDSPSFTATEVDLEKLLAELAAIFVANHKRLSFAAGFPSLTGDLPTAALGLEARATTTLRRLTGDNTLAELLTRNAQDVFSIKGTAEQTVADIAYGLLVCTVLSDVGATILVTDESHGEPPAITQLLDDIAQLSAWQRVRGGAAKPLVKVTIDDEAPEAIQEVAARINALTPQDLPDPGTGDAIDEIENLVAQLDVREKFVLRERLMAAQPISIGELSTKLHLSKPATSAIESRIKAKFNDACGYGTAVGMLTASLRVEIQPVASLDRLLTIHPQIRADVPSLDVPLWLVLDRLDDYFEVTEGWAAAPDVSAAKARTQSLIEDLESPNGVVSLDDLTGVVAMSRAELESWLRWGEFTVVAGSVLTRVKKLSDALVGALEAIGEPRSAEDLASIVHSGRTDVALRRTLGSDDRVSVNADGLWKLEAWASGDEHSDTSFAADGTGAVRRRTNQGAKSPDRTRRLYRMGVAWRYRIVVTADHLRGSGFALPAGVAAAVACDRGDVVELDSRLGTQMIRWTGAQPTSGTIRRFLADLSVGVGDSVLLDFWPDRTFDVLKPVELGDDVDPLRRALALIGVLDPMAVAERHVPRMLADAIGLHGETRPRRLLSAYEDNGEDTVVALLEQAWLTKVESASE